jgi:putative addiction module component (TIGR02574 family)
VYAFLAGGAADLSGTIEANWPFGGNRVSIELDALKQEAAKLSQAERAELALALIESLDPATESPEDVERAWQIEIERRVGEIERGEVELIPGDEVLAEVRRQLG